MLNTIVPFVSQKISIVPMKKRFEKKKNFIENNHLGQSFLIFLKSSTQWPMAVFIDNPLITFSQSSSAGAEKFINLVTFDEIFIFRKSVDSFHTYFPDIQR